jgi:hypothetical protein
VNTYVVTFYDENDGDPSDVEVRAVEISSAVEPDDLAAGDWDAHSLVVEQARVRESLGHEWDAAYVTLPDGEIATVPAGL